MKPNRSILLAIAILAASPAAVIAADATLAPQQVPAKSLPVPTADVSPEMQAFIAAPLNPIWNTLWKTGEEVRAFANEQAAGVVKGLPEIRARLQVSVEPATMDGVKVYVATPKTIPLENADKLLIQHPVRHPVRRLRHRSTRRTDRR